ncbi:MAG: hypothetical protein RLZZ436_605 [Planctomycetota bacterium]|jgi:hypothetical protein
MRFPQILRHSLLCPILFTAIAAPAESCTPAAQEVSPLPSGETVSAASVTSRTPADLAGTWRGTWHSDSTGHKGPMQARFRCAGAGRWEVVFRGRFCALIPFQYSAVLHEQRSEDGTVRLSGSRNLGPLFGTFHFRGTVTCGQLNARWWSKKESGSFVLSR